MLAANPIRVAASLPNGDLHLLQEWLGTEIAARIDPGAAATHAAGPHMKLIALILRHELTILIGQAPRKSRDGSIA
jgi:hypothetical protein